MRFAWGIDDSGAAPVIVKPRGLTEIWIRSPGDLFDRRVPLKVECLVGDGAPGSRFLVVAPPGVKVEQKIDMPKGMAVLVYDDGTYVKLEGREPKMYVPGGLS